MKEKETEIQKLKEEYHLALSRISHEIRNPVTLINSSMQLMEAEHPEVAGIDLWSLVRYEKRYAFSTETPG